MMVKPILITSLFLVVIACAASRAVTNTPTVVSKKETTTAQKSPPTQTIQDTVPPPVFKIDTLFYVSHGPCYGKCPVYDLTIFTDGTVLKNAVKFVDKSGQFVGQLMKNQINELEQAIANGGPWVGKEYYPAKNEFISDFPTTTYIIKWKDQSKTSIVNHSPPAILKFLDDKVMAWMDILVWKNISN